MAGYAVNAGIGHLSIVWMARPIEEVLNDPKAEETVKIRLRHVLDVRNFAQEKINLKTGESFTRYSAIGREAAAWNVTASEPLQLKARTWYFPVVGSVPYIGFYSKEEAEHFAEGLKKEGYDVLVSDVPAYSTLGWFSDPVLSSQVVYPEWFLTRLVIHESAHSTLWFPDDVSFNESFASFVEIEGSLQYYRDTKGANDKFVKKYELMLSERATLNGIMADQAALLTDLFKSNLSDSEKKIKKTEIINNLRKYLKENRGQFKVIRAESLAGEEFNNAYFLSYTRYGSGNDYFRKEFLNSKGDWKMFFEKMAELQNLTSKDRASLLENPEKLSD
jgi:predicted aminopeptidase